MNKTNKKGLARLATAKGFTIIELIVVIAIIAVLAGIVLVNVTQYINKSKTAAIQANLSTVETNMAAYLADPTNSSAHGSDINDATKVTACGTTAATYLAITSAGGSGSLTCWGKTTSSDWCAKATTPSVTSGSTSAWCVDSTGYHGSTTTNCSSATSTSCQ